MLQILVLYWKSPAYDSTTTVPGCINTSICRSIIFFFRTDTWPLFLKFVLVDTQVQILETMAMYMLYCYGIVQYMKLYKIELYSYIILHACI